jgi:hypothetical protein
VGFREAGMSDKEKMNIFWAMLLVGCSTTLLALSLGIFLSKKNK